MIRQLLVQVRAHLRRAVVAERPRSARSTRPSTRRMVTGLTLRVALGIDIACVAVGALAGALVSGSEPLPYRGGVCIEYYQGTFGPTLRVEVSTRFLTGIFAEPFTLVSRFISNAGRQSEPDPASSWHPLEAPAARPPA